MKFSEIPIQTQRSAPADLRTTGWALLYRAGYLSRSGEVLPLGQSAIKSLTRAYERLQYPGMMPAFLERLGLPAVHDSVAGESFVLLPAGTNEVLYCPACGSAARHETARCRRQSFSQEEPAPVEKILTPECSTIAQLAQFLGIPQQKTCKALMFTIESDGKFIFVVVRGDLQMSGAKLQGLLGNVRLATPQEVAASGAVAGFASPVGLKNIFVVVDELVARSPNLVAGANEDGYHLKNTNFPRDYQADLVADVCLANPGDECQQCGAPLELRQALVVFSNGQPSLENLLLAVAEIHHDEKGLTLPEEAAPFDVYLMHVPGKLIDTARAAQELYARLCENGITVLYDDRDERAGVKFNDADLIGCPVRVTVGERGLQNGLFEVKRRSEAEIRQVDAATLVAELLPGQAA